MTRVELADELVRRMEPDPLEQKRARGWLGVARDLVASVVESGLNLPDAAALIRGERAELDLKSPEPVATVTLAEIYATQGHVQRAVAMLDEVLANEPDHEAAQRLRERLQRERPGRMRAPQSRRSMSAAEAEMVSATTAAAGAEPVAVAIADLAAEAEAIVEAATAEDAVAEAEVEAAADEAAGAVAEPVAQIAHAPPADAEPPMLDVPADLPNPVGLGTEAAQVEAEPSEPPRSGPSEPPRSEPSEPATSPLSEPAPEPDEAAGEPNDEGAADSEPPPTYEEDPVTYMKELSSSEGVGGDSVGATTDEGIRSDSEPPSSEPETERPTVPLLPSDEPPADLQAPIVVLVRARGVEPLVCWDLGAPLPDEGQLAIACVAFAGSADGIEKNELTVAVNEARGSAALESVPATAVLRVALGLEEKDGFLPLAIGSEIELRDGQLKLSYRPPGAERAEPTEAERALVQAFTE
jgi:hypothetical protein